MAADAPLSMHCPPLVAWSERLPLQVVLYGRDGALIEEGLAQLGPQAVGVDYFGPLSGAPRQQKLGERGMVVYPSGVEELVDNIHRLARGGVLVRLASGPGLLEQARLAASLGLPVDLLYNRSAISQEQAGGLLEHYLHHHALQAPLEPFHTILACLLDSRNLDLWELARCNPERYLFADQEGNLAASYDDLAAGRCLGSVWDPPGAWQQSGPGRGLREYQEGLPRLQPECLACQFFFFCRGFLRYQAASCQAWQEAFALLSQALGEIAQAREQWRALAGRDQGAGGEPS
ncbi:MAG: hypothetical protein C4525_05915 [Desulfarculus sp.]|nr:MAG: hypothetical protein C4525_05915 [Desulfarculus sp.]